MKRRRVRTPKYSVRNERTKELYAAYAEAARDSAFLAEMHDVDRAFDVTVADGLDETDHE